MTKTGKIIRVVGAAIIQDGQVLCLQRGQEMSLAGLWEFPRRQARSWRDRSPSSGPGN